MYYHSAKMNRKINNYKPSFRTQEMIKKIKIIRPKLIKPEELYLPGYKAV
jgi:hypothetical protein